MKSLTEVLADLDRKGYRESFRAEDGGLRAMDSGRLFEIADVDVDELVRLEVGSDPDGQILVMALRVAEQHLCGTYVVPYGPNMPKADVSAVQRLDV